MDEHKGYKETENPFSESKIALFKNAIKDSRYFLEAVNYILQHNRMCIPMLSWHNDERDFCNLFNLNMGHYILNSHLLTKVLEINSIYDKKFMEGYSSFDKTLSSLPVNSHKTWNSLLTIYRGTFKKELLDERTVFSDEEVQRSFYQSGRATRYWEFEEDNSIILANYFMLESSGSKGFPFAKNPIINRYHTSVPDISKKIKVAPKVEFIILKEIGVVDELLTKKTSSAVATEISRMINEKHNLTEDSLKCTSANIRNILIADSFFPDHTSPKTAYKRNNIKKALVQLSSMGVHLDQCRYFPSLKLTHPDLFP